MENAQKKLKMYVEREEGKHTHKKKREWKTQEKTEWKMQKKLKMYVQSE
jgi:hypothetical protein